MLYSHLDLKPKRKIHLKQMMGCCRLSVILLQISVVAPRLSPSSNSANQPAEGDDTTPIYSRFWKGCRLMEQIDQLGAMVKAGAVVCCALQTFVRLLFWAGMISALEERRALFGLPQVNKPQRGLHAVFLVPSVCRQACFVEVVKNVWALLWICALFSGLWAPFGLFAFVFPGNQSSRA